MKPTLYLLLFFLLTAAITLAQTPKRTQVYIRAGVGGSRAIGGQASSEEYGTITENVPVTLGGNQWLFVGTAGVGLRVPVGQHFTIQAEVNVEQKGSAEKLTSVTPRPNALCDFGCFTRAAIDGQLSSRLTYITLPVMVGYQFGKVALSAGPYISYKLAEKLRGTYSFPYRTDVLYSVDALVRGYKDLDAGFVAAVTYAVTPRIGVDLRYNQGLRYIAKPFRYGYSGDERTEFFYNQSAQLAVRYNLIR